jgi:hypothetical protein
VSCTGGDYSINGNFTFSAENEAYVSGGPGGAILEDKFSKGSIEATMIAPISSPEFARENGIMFGFTDLDTDAQVNDIYDEYYLFYTTSKGGLALKRFARRGLPWEVKVSAADAGYTHGDAIVMKAEYDGKGNIKCYLNGKLVIEYTDKNPLTGVGCGFYAHDQGVTFKNITVSAS